MFVGTDSWNTDFIFWNASSLKFSFEKIPNDESLKRPTYASAWWKFNDDRRRILLIKVHLIKMQMKFKKTTPFITFCYVSLQTKTFKRFRW